MWYFLVVHQFAAEQTTPTAGGDMCTTSPTEPISALRWWIWSPLRCGAQAFNSRIINPWRTQLRPEKLLRWVVGLVEGTFRELGKKYQAIVWLRPESNSIDHPSVQGRIKLVKEIQGTWRARLRMRRRRGTGLSEQEEKKRHPCFMQWFAPESNGLPQVKEGGRSGSYCVSVDFNLALNTSGSPEPKKKQISFMGWLLPDSNGRPSDTTLKYWPPVEGVAIHEADIGAVVQCPRTIRVKYWSRCRLPVALFARKPVVDLA
ncbi:hypothetical protein B0H13DRAFT_1862958 [Mycena leptocephala]|nr:hypothetical protein B0H13DRAFT_1862958 [Mycena leptocephala]